MSKYTLADVNNAISRQLREVKYLNYGVEKAQEAADQASARLCRLEEALPALAQQEYLDNLLSDLLQEPVPAGAGAPQEKVNRSYQDAVEVANEEEQS